jgi:hypothetical protein
MSADKEPACGAAAAVRATLGTSRTAAACVSLARRITQLAGGAFEHVSGQEPVACREGCSFCCHLQVMVHPHEAIALAVHVQARPPAEGGGLLKELLLAAAARRTLPDGATPVPAMPCAFLTGGRCSVYGLRPAACAVYHSLHRGACERRYETVGGSVGIPVSRALHAVAATIHDEVGQAVAALGLAAGRVELATAVGALLCEPSLIDRWLAGGQWERDSRGRVRRG